MCSVFEKRQNWGILAGKERVETVDSSLHIVRFGNALKCIEIASRISSVRTVVVTLDLRAALGAF